MEQMGAHTAQASGQQVVSHRGAKRKANLWEGKHLETLPLAVAAAAQGVHKAAAMQVFRNLAGEAGVAAGKLRGQLIPDSTWKRAGEVLGPSASETMARLANTLFVAERIWRNEGDAIRFLLRPHIELGKVSPYSLLNTESGGRTVENLLAALEYGFPV
jgi:putative toxin-antitoxin system antitoxin component (TIGR02293 family)